MIRKMVTIYNTTLSATSQRHFSDGLGGGYDMVNNNGSTVMPSELYDTLYQELLKQVIEKLETGLNVDSEECLDDCIFSSCYWLPEHILGCRDLDCNTTMDEIVDSIGSPAKFRGIM